MRKELMIDLETLSTRSNAAIISIGVAVMDTDALMVVDSAKWNVIAETSQDVGLHIDANTVMWWLGQPVDAKQHLFTPQPIPLLSALQELYARFYADDSFPTWGNGAAFDNVILRSAYEASNMPCPYVYSHDRCYRTMKNMYPFIKPLESTAEFVKHDAMHDALYQAEHLLEIMRYIRRQNEPVHQNRPELSNH